jgi:hypothetical protein
MSGRPASCRARAIAAFTAPIGANVVGETGSGRTRARNDTAVSISSEPSHDRSPTGPRRSGRCDRRGA